MYINSSSHGRTGEMAHLKSPLSPPTEPDGYCFTFWYHMFGATVGSLRMSIYDISSNHITLVRLTRIIFSWDFLMSYVRNAIILTPKNVFVSKTVDVAKEGVSEE